MHMHRISALKEADNLAVSYKHIDGGELMEFSRLRHSCSRRHMRHNHVSDQVTSTLQSRHCHRVKHLSSTTAAAPHPTHSHLFILPGWRLHVSTPRLHSFFKLFIHFKCKWKLDSTNSGIAVRNLMPKTKVICVLC